MDTPEEEAEALGSAIAVVQSTRFDPASRTIYLLNDIDSDSAGIAMITLMTADQSPGDIRIVLNSVGGECHSGMALYDAIKNCRNRVIVDAYGACASIAAIILQAADIRRVAANVEFMVHNGKVHLCEDSSDTAEGLSAMTKQLVRMDRSLHSILAKRSGNMVAQIRKWLQQDFYLTASRAIKLGFADELIQGVK